VPFGARDLGADQPELVAERLRERRADVRVRVVPVAVDDELNQR